MCNAMRSASAVSQSVWGCSGPKFAATLAASGALVIGGIEHVLHERTARRLRQHSACHQVFYRLEGLVPGPDRPPPGFNGSLPLLGEYCGGAPKSILPRRSCSNPSWRTVSISPPSHLGLRPCWPSQPVTTGLEGGGVPSLPPGLLDWPPPEGLLACPWHWPPC